METVLKDLGKYKSNILTSLLNSDDIKDIITDGKYDEEEWYGINDDDNGILYKQIFPALYIDETQTEVKSYICFDTECPRIPTGTTKNVKIIVWCLCHKQHMRYNKKGYWGNRADILADAVEQTLREFEKNNIKKGKGKYGIGSLQLESVTIRSSDNKKYYGRQLVFNAPDFLFKDKE